MFFFNNVQVNYALKFLIIIRVVKRKMGKMRTCNVSLWFHVFVEVGLDKGEPLLDAALDVSAAFAHITEH